MLECNKSKLAEIFGVTIQTIDQWVRDGMPVLERPGQKGHEWKFETSEAINWRIGNRIEAAVKGKKAGRKAAPADLDDPETAARIRKLNADAEAKEHSLALLRREAVSITDFESALNAAISAARGKLLGMGAHLAPVVAIESDVNTCQASIDAVVREILQELSDLRPEVQLEDGDPEAEEVPVGA